MYIPHAVRQIFNGLENKYEYMDNYRAALVGDQKAEAEYNKIRDQGCCGSYDEVVTIDGQEWRIGFNYGH